MCPNGTAMLGVASQHSDMLEDRRWLVHLRMRLADDAASSQYKINDRRQLPGDADASASCPVMRSASCPVMRMPGDADAR